MDRDTDINEILLRGRVAERPVFSHEGHGERYYQFPLAVERLSGNEDVLNLQASGALLAGCDVAPGREVEVRGSVRTFNNRTGPGSKLVITVLCAAIHPWEGPHANQLTLVGTVCRLSPPRRTPLGREICDFTLAVNRRYGRADYLPCISWGTMAQRSAGLPVGSRIRLEGRLQSRGYVKRYQDHSEERVAYEVSAMEILPEDAP